MAWSISLYSILYKKYKVYSQIKYQKNIKKGLTLFQKQVYYSYDNK